MIIPSVIAFPIFVGINCDGNPGMIFSCFMALGRTWMVDKKIRPDISSIGRAVLACQEKRATRCRFYITVLTGSSDRATSDYGDIFSATT
jgi:hypothetical protein